MNGIPNIFQAGGHVLTQLGGGGSTAHTVSPLRSFVDGFGALPLTETASSRMRRCTEVRLRKGMRSTR